MLSIQEQLAQITNEDRFVVLEKETSMHPSGRRVIGYVIVDREVNNMFTTPVRKHGEANKKLHTIGVYIEKSDAESDCQMLNTDPARIPTSNRPWKYEPSLMKALVRGNLEDMGSDVPDEVKAEQPKRDISQPAPKKNVTFDGQYESGEIITDSRNNAQYRAVEQFYITASQSDFASDDGVYIAPGWHTKAELVSE